MALAPDIQARVAADFGTADAAAVRELLEGERRAVPDVFGDRILRCAVYVAAGDVDELLRALALARLDPRDLIVWAEYDNVFGPRLRDLSKPFPARGPDTQ
jgi:hypothetical protein